MNYEVEGQMSIFDFLKPDAEVKVYYKVDELYVWKTVHCSECVNANINVNDEKFCKYTECSKNGYSNFESKEKTICKFSEHECNKKELWKVADTLNLDLPCPHVCCRLCTDTMCGARCNGSTRPKPKIRQWHRFCKMEPPEDVLLEIMYTHRAFGTPTVGQCKGYWKNGQVTWKNIPPDIGKKELEAWREAKE